MRRARFGAAVAGILALAACAQLKEFAGSPEDYVAKHTAENLEKVSDNAITAADSGDLSKSASFSMEQEFYLGKSVAANVLARLGGRALEPEHPAARYLRDVGTAVALAAAEQRKSEDRPYPLKGYRFLVVDAPGINAVGTPGGFVVVTTGALRAARSEDEIAAVVAHEIAHVQLGHAMSPVEQARRQEHITSTLLEGTDELVHAFLGKVVTLSADFVLDKGYGKANELAADAFAERVLEATGYDPRALQRFLSGLRGKAAEGGFFSRHPPASERIAALAGRGKVAAASAGARQRLARFEAHRQALE